MQPAPGYPRPSNPQPRKNTEVPLEAFCNSSVAKCIFWHLETQPSTGKVCLLPTL